MQVSRIDNRINCQKNIWFGTKKLTTLVNANETKPAKNIAPDKFDLKGYFERMKEISRQSRIHFAQAIKRTKEIKIK